MSAIFMLIGFSLAIAVAFLAAFLWATRSGQFDDDYTPAIRMILDDRKPGAEPAATNSHTSKTATQPNSES